RGVDAGLDAQKPSAAAHLAALVEIARENFLLNTRRIPRRRGPAAIHVDPGELEMRLVHRHGCSPAISRSSPDGRLHAILRPRIKLLLPGAIITAAVSNSTSA